MPPTNDPTSPGDESAAVLVARPVRKASELVIWLHAKGWCFARMIKDRILSFLFGDDLFISYARADAVSYAATLASKLTEKNFACYLDQWTTAPSAGLPLDLITAIRRSGIFVLLATNASLKSSAIEQEVHEFLKTKRPFLVIALAEKLDATGWHKKLNGCAITIDARGQISGEPSDEVVGRIVSSFNTRTRNQRLKRTSFAVVITTLFIVSASGVVTRYLVSSATKKLNAALTKTEQATTAMNQAKSAANAAETRRSDAERQFQALDAANGALRLYDEDPRRALELAVNGHSILDVVQTRNALGSALFRDPYLKAFIPITSSDPRIPGAKLGFSTGKKPVLLMAQNDKLTIWQPTVPQQIPDIYDNHDPISAFAATDTTVFITSQGRGHSNPYLRIINRRQRGKGRTVPIAANFVSHLIAASPTRLIGLAPFEGITEWNLATGQEQMITRWKDQVSSAFAVSPGGNRIAFDTPKTVSPNVRGAESITILARNDKGEWISSAVRTRGNVGDIAFRDDDHLMTAYSDGVVMQYSLSPPGEEEIPAHRVEFGPRRFSRNGRALATEDGGSIYIGIFDPASAYRLARSRRLSGSDGDEFAFDDNAHYFAAPVQAGYIGLWDLSLPLDLREVRDLGSPIVSFGYESASGTFAGVTYTDYNAALHVRCGAMAQQFDGRIHVGAFVAMAPYPSEDRLLKKNFCQTSWRIAQATTLDDRLVVSTISPSRTESATVQAGVRFGTRPTFSSDGTYLMHCGKGFNLLNVREPSRPLRLPTTRAIECGVSSPSAFSNTPDVIALAGPENDRVDIWNLKTGKRLTSLAESDFDQITSLAFSPDNRMLAVGMIGSRVNIWSAEWEPELQLSRLTPPDSLLLDQAGLQVVGLRFSSDGSHLYAWNTRSLYEIPSSADALARVATERLIKVQRR